MVNNSIVPVHLSLALQYVKRKVIAVRRGGSNSIVSQYYCKVLQYFGIATSQSITISIAILITKLSSIAKSIVKFSSIAKRFVKFFKYCKKYCKKLSIVKSVVKYESIAKSIAKYESIAKSIAKFWRSGKKISAVVFFTEF